jgi:hypothetical protein
MRNQSTPALVVWLVAVAAACLALGLLVISDGLAVLGVTQILLAFVLIGIAIKLKRGNRS